MNSIYFQNNTDLPIMIEYWANELWSEEQCYINSIKIKPREKRNIYSSLGEWTLHSIFSNIKDTKIWCDKGYKISNNIVSFNINGIINLNTSDFYCTYTPLEGEDLIKGLFTFHCKKIKID